MNTNERLAVLTAVSRIAKAALAEARAQAEKELTEAFAANGTDRARLMLDGTEVGSVTLRTDRKGWEVTDQEAFEEFLADNGQLSVVRRLKPECQHEAWSLLHEEHPHMFEEERKPEQAFLKTFERVGDAVVVSGTDVVVPGVSPCPAKATGIMVAGCKPQLVGPIAARLGGLDALLLPEGGDE